MPDNYYMPLDALEKLWNLKKAYNDVKSKKAGTPFDVDTAPEPWGIFTTFGATDVVVRRRQFPELAKWMVGLDLTPEKCKQMLPGSTPDSTEASPKAAVTPEGWEKFVSSCRIMLAYSMFLKSQVAEKYSTTIYTYCLPSPEWADLHCLLDAAFGISIDNPIDEETRICCIQTAKLHLDGGAEYVAFNARLKQAHCDTLTMTQWNGFTSFIRNQYEKIEDLKNRQYPITRMIIPVFSVPLQLAGRSAGLLAGHIAAQSTPAIGLHTAMTKTLGACVLFLVPSAKLGATLVLSSYASYMSEAALGISGFQLLGTAGKYVGTGMGYAIGMPLDLGSKALQRIIHLLKLQYHHYKHGKPVISGLCLMDGSILEHKPPQAAPVQPPLAEVTTSSSSESATSSSSSSSSSSSAMEPTPPAPTAEFSIEYDEMTKSLFMVRADGAKAPIPCEVIAELPEDALVVTDAEKPRPDAAASDASLSYTGFSLSMN